MIRQKTSGNDYPRIKVVTPTMINIVEVNTIKRLGTGEYKWYECRYSPSEYVEKLFIENESLNKQVNEDNETILDLAYSNEQLQDQVSEDNEMILDIDYRLSQIEDKEA